MTSLFAKILKQSLITFDIQNANTFTFNANFIALKQLVDQVTTNDLNLDAEIMSDDCFQSPIKAPCTFVNIFENEAVSMSVFILRGEYAMPLHDHPKMHGLLKVLCGNLLVNSYTKRQISLETKNGTSLSVSRKQLSVMQHPSKLLNKFSECAILMPTERNFHELKAVEHVSCFFDILSPPYDVNHPLYGIRKCSFYRKMKNSSTENTSDHQLILEKIPIPSSYYCDSYEYNPPDFIYEYL